MTARILPICLSFAAASCGLPGIPGDDAFDANVKENPFVPIDNYLPGDGDAVAFAIDSIEPSRGPVTGGTFVEVKGIGFLPGTTVVFGSSEGIDVVFENEGSLLARSPPGNAGPVDLKVVRPDGKFVVASDGFFYETAIAVLSVEPSMGPVSGGTPLRVTGSGFLPDSALMVGGRLAISPHFLDAGTVVAISPPGTVGPRDVAVFNALGSGTSKKAFTYVQPPVASSCDPVVVFDGQDALVTVIGSDMDAVTGVLATNGTASLASDPTGSSVQVLLRPEAPGPVGLTLLSAFGQSFLDACAIALDPYAQQDVPELHGLVPAMGHASGGYQVSVIATGLSESWAGDVSIELGGKPTEVVSFDPGKDILSVTAPQHEPGLVGCAMFTPGGDDFLYGAFRYLPEVVVESVSPDFGPASGGTEVLLVGKNLEQVQTVFVGPLPAEIVSGPAPGSIRVVTAAANPGVHDVDVVTAWGDRASLADAFTFGSMEPGLFTVAPEYGSQAGGTLVAIVGSGLDSATSVRFGDRQAQVLDGTDPARLLTRTPMGEPGQVDVTVDWPDGTSLTLAGAYTYFDPTGYFGGVWGDVVNGALNVTVLDSYNGKPVQGAFAILGEEASTPYRGITDLRGQITFSGEDVFGPAQVTATRPDYSTFTVSGVDAENVTVFLDPVVPSSGGGGGSSSTILPDGIVSGRVLGADKYLLAPPASCEDRPLVYGKLCAPCVTDDECGNGGRCLNPSGKGHHCAVDCLAEDDCPPTYECYGLGAGGSACLPSPGNPEIRCGTSIRGDFGSEQDHGPGFVAGEDGFYSVFSRLGDVAIYCLGGLRRWEDGEFEPVAMGLLRHVSVYPLQVTDDQDIRLDIPLDRELPVRLLNVPGGPGGPQDHGVRLALELGSDGTLRLWPDLRGTDAEHFVFSHLPRYFVSQLEEAKIHVRADAKSLTPNGIPYSSSMVREFEPGAAPAVARISGDLVVMLDPQARPDATGGCSVPGGGGIVFSPGGRAWEVDPFGNVAQMQSLAFATLRDCKALEDGGVLAVGDHGSVVRWDGSFAAQVTAPTSRRLNAVDIAPDGTEFAVGDGVLLVREPQSEWKSVAYGSKAPLNDVVAAPDSSAIAVGDGGLVVRINGSAAAPLLPYPTSSDLFAAARWGFGVVMVGARGVSILGGFDGAFLELDTPISYDLNAILAMPDGTLLAAGAAGSVIRYEDGKWVGTASSGFDGEVTTLLQGDDGSAIALSGDIVTIGPFLYLPEFSSPAPGGVWTDLDIAWTRGAPPDPSLTYTRLYGPKSAREWAVMADGPIESIRLPDLPVAAADYMEVSPLPGGEIRLHSIQMLMDHFDINAFDTNAFSMSEWRSWTVDEFSFLKP